MNDEAAALDVYARPFIPQSFRDVNLAPAQVLASEGVRWIDFEAYVRSFVGSMFLLPEPDDTTSSSSEQQDFTSWRLSRPPLYLNPGNYGPYFADALAHERSALDRECEEHGMFRVPLSPARAGDVRPGMYWLVVPGLRESTLRIEIGDVVRLRQLRLDSRGMAVVQPVVFGTPTHLTDPEGNPLRLPPRQKTDMQQHDAVVWGLDRYREVLTLKVDGLVARSMLFNVVFTQQTVRLEALDRSAASIHTSLSTGRHVWLQSMLFPESKHGAMQSTLGTATFNLKLHDDSLNYEQCKAVNAVINEIYGTIPFLISGPPGTGKTKTIVEIALQLLQSSNEGCLLVCAPSDSASDTLVERLSRHLTPKQLLRLNAPSRGFPEVPMTILPFCCVDQDMFSLPSFADTMRLRVVVTSCRDADILLKARLTNRDLSHLEQAMYATMHPGQRSRYPPTLHWTALLMDEAAQATEPESLLPLLVVMPPAQELDPKDAPCLIMAGDQYQLGPRTADRMNLMRTSLFERLLQRDVYSQHPLARSKQRGGVMRRLTQDMLPILRPAFTNLIRNYRSHPAILATPSALFYNDTLEPEATDVDSLVPWFTQRGCRWPVLFACNYGQDEIEQDGGGWYNVSEADLATTFMRSLLETCSLRQEEICVMSPFSTQVKLLRHKARQQGMGMVNIGPLEAFQGLESRVVIVCTTRVRSRFLAQDHARGLGMIDEPRRFNVALTRAKEGLVIIGNASVLLQDSNWGRLLGFCHRNGLVVDERGGVQLQSLATAAAAAGAFGAMSTSRDLEVDNGHVSRLERRLLLYEEVDARREMHDRGPSHDMRTLGQAWSQDAQRWSR